MEWLGWVRWLHLVSAAVWTGGLIVLAALVGALRRHGAERSLLRAAARQFARVSWVAMGVAVITGVTQVLLLRWPWTYGRLHLKLGLVGLAIVLAGVHQLTARRSPLVVRIVFEMLLLIVGLAVFAAAVAL